MTDRKAIKRLLERLGFVHVAGWVRNADAPAIRRKIEAAREEVEKVKRVETAPPRLFSSANRTFPDCQKVADIA